MSGLNPRWELPEFTMNAGETKILRLPIFNRGGLSVDVSGMSARLAISDYVTGTQPRWHGDCSVVDDATTGSVVFRVELHPEATVDLNGKYIYQLTVIDSASNTTGVLQGILNVRANRDPSALKQ